MNNENFNNMDKYILYCTVNKINGKIYIGVHRTPTPYEFDGYLGCGAFIDSSSSYNKCKVPLHAAINKYGIESFYRITLMVFDTYEEALKQEAIIVNEEFVKNPMTYNATVGGGLPPLLTVKMYQFDLKGNLIKEWESQTEINNYFGTHVNFADIIRNKRTFAGYLWSYDKFITLDNIKTETNHGFISQYDLDGNLIRLYKNTTDAAEELNFIREYITQAVFRKKPYKNFYFLKSDVDIKEVLSDKFKRKCNRQPVYRYLESGEFDAEFDTTANAVKNTPKAHSSAIKNAVVNGKLCGGYRWSYKKSNNYFNISNPTEYKKVTKIKQLSLTGDLIKIWDKDECKKEFKNCLKVCQGSLKSTQGYKFEYCDD